MATQNYEFRELNIEPRAVAGVRAQVRRGRAGQEFARYLDQVYAAKKSGAVQLDGQNIFIYRSLTDDMLTVDFCVGVTAPFVTVGAVTALETPSGAVVMTTHHGAYAGLANASVALDEWCRVNGRARTGVSWEVYGHWHSDVEQLRTDVYCQLAP